MGIAPPPSSVVLSDDAENPQRRELDRAPHAHAIRLRCALAQPAGCPHRLLKVRSGIPLRKYRSCGGASRDVAYPETMSRFRGTSDAAAEEIQLQDQIARRLPQRDLPEPMYGWGKRRRQFQVHEPVSGRGQNAHIFSEMLLTERLNRNLDGCAVRNDRAEDTGWPWRPLHDDGAVRDALSGRARFWGSQNQT